MFGPIRCALLVCAAALVAGQAHGQAQVPPPANRSSAPASELPPHELVDVLKRGGLILYFRHAATDFSQNDSRMTSYEDCTTQRNLIDKGRADARRIGAALKALAVPIGNVQASPLCRTMETARLIFGKAQASTDVRSRNVNPNDAERFAPLRAIFQATVPAGANLGIVSHGNPFYAVAGPPYLAEAEGAVIRPLGQDFEVLARLKVDDWAALPKNAR
jgi:phosphohistidine phosphatase SixA